MAPVVKNLQRRNAFDVRVCVTGQHKEMLAQVLEVFEIEPDYDLKLMRPGQDLTDITSRALPGLRDVYAEFSPDVVMVHGDTATCFTATLAAYFARIDVAHVEAGLRTGDLDSPWPEEGMRKLTGGLARLHFAPTQSARENLLRENVSDSQICVTGNTVVDALLDISARLDSNPDLGGAFFRDSEFLSSDRNMILVTGHRRESFGDGFVQICGALQELAKRDDINIVYPVHLNPRVRGPVEELLQGLDNVHLIEPLSYVPFVYLMKKSHFILTDSGGIQEEAPSLGKPVLVMRDTTERPEAVDAGTVRLVGPNRARIVEASTQLLDSGAAYDAMSKATNPYGDGTASDQISDELIARYS